MTPPAPARCQDPIQHRIQRVTVASRCCYPSSLARRCNPWNDNHHSRLLTLRQANIIWFMSTANCLRPSCAGSCRGPRQVAGRRIASHQLLHRSVQRSVSSLARSRSPCSVISNIVRDLVLGRYSSFPSWAGAGNVGDVAAVLWGIRFLPVVEMTSGSVEMTGGAWVRRSSWTHQVGHGKSLACPEPWTPGGALAS